MPRPVDVVASLGHIATRQQLLAAGCSGFDLTSAVRTGELSRVRQGRYATALAPFEAVVAVRVGGLLAGPSAANSYGLWHGFDDRVHVSVGANSSRLRTVREPAFADPLVDRMHVPVVVHWLTDGATPELGPECWRVPLLTCLRQTVAWSDRETGLACLDTALRLVTRGEILDAFRDAPTADRMLAGLCRYGSGSGTESIVRQRLAAIGIAVNQQVHIPRVGRVDMVVRGTRVVIEVDSKRWHHNPIAFEDDLRRSAELAAQGYTLVRLSYERVINDWAWCERMVRAALSSFRR